MMKNNMKKIIDFSIIVPIYNVDKYIKNCLDSIINQTHKNYEVIMIDDASIDNSVKVAESYLGDKRFSLYLNEHCGLSGVRNFGVSKSKGKYLIFIDSDDSINKDLLKKIYDTLRKYESVDLVRYGVSFIQNNEKKNTRQNFYEFNDSVPAFNLLLGSEILDTACIYAFNRKFYISNKFKFKVGKFHEDFGLIPYVLLKSKSSSSINYYGYNYYKRENSITTTDSNNIKRVYDKLFFYDDLLEKIKDDKLIKSGSVALFKSYIANAVINTSKILSGVDLDQYIKELKKRKVYNNLYKNTIGRLSKYLFVKYFMTIYIKKIL